VIFVFLGLIFPNFWRSWWWFRCWSWKSWRFGITFR
jgi:hypothetical protein